MRKRLGNQFLFCLLMNKCLDFYSLSNIIVNTMIESKNVKVTLNEVDEYIKTVSIFDWKVTNKEILGFKVSLTLTRETETPYYNEIKELEKKWKNETSISALPTYIFVGIALILITIYLVILLNNNDSDGNLVFQITPFLSFMVPGILSFLLAAGYSFFRSRKIQKIIVSYYELRREYDIKAQELKGIKQ